MSGVDHQRKFKNASRSDDQRRRRAEGSVELRKTHKDEQLMKRRNIDFEADDGTTSDDSVLDTSETAATKKVQRPFLSLQECMHIFHTDASRVYDAVESIRRLLSRNTSPVVSDVIDAGALPYLVLALEYPNDDVKFEAAWALTNVCSGTAEQTRMAVEAGVVPLLVNLLNSDSFRIAEQVCWALGNVAGDCAALRDIVIDSNILQPLKAILTKPISIEFYRTLSWTLSNLCRYKNPMPPFGAVKEILPILLSLLDHRDEAVVLDSCWALCYLSDSTDDRIEFLVQNGVVSKVVTFLHSQNYRLVAPAVRCLGNIVTGSDEQTQAVVDTGVLSAIPHLILTGKQVIVKETMWMLSNIAAGNHSQIQAILQADLISLVIEVIKKADHKSQYEACWVVANLMNGASPDQEEYLIKFEEQLIHGVCNCLKSKENTMLLLCLNVIASLLQVAAKRGDLEHSTTLVEECGGLDNIEELQTHANENIYNKALFIIENFFSDEANEQETLANGKGAHVPDDPNGGDFVF